MDFMNRLNRSMPRPPIVDRELNSIVAQRLCAITERMCNHIMLVYAHGGNRLYG